MHETTNWVGDNIVIETYIESSVAVPTGIGREFDVVWKVVNLSKMVAKIDEEEDLVCGVTLTRTPLKQSVHVCVCVRDSVAWLKWDTYLSNRCITWLGAPYGFRVIMHPDSFVDFGAVYVVCLFTWLPPHTYFFFTYFSLFIYFLTYRSFPLRIGPEDVRGNQTWA